MSRQGISNIGTKKVLEKTSKSLVVKNIDKPSFLQRLLPLPWEIWPSEARLLLALIAFWSIAGLFILGSASWWVANKDMGDGTFFLKRQLLWLITSWSIAWLTISISLRKWLKFSRIALLISLFLVGSTLIFGSTINGSSRWLIIGKLRLQPSELIKPFIILQAANLFAQWKRVKIEQKVFTISIFSGVILLILKQPNLSTAALIGILLWLMAFAAGINLKSLLLTASLGLSLGAASILKHDYQKLRIISFINPWQDPENTGYQLRQSLLAIGSGGFLGEGYGLSTQKLFYLPFSSTDFIFAVFAEEFGFIGSLMMILFFFLIAFIGLRITLRCKNNYSKLIAAGCSILLIGQAIMHLAVVSGSMPTTGLPLPIVSYGGSSLLASLLIAGLLLRCSLESTGLIGGLEIKKRFQ